MNEEADTVDDANGHDGLGEGPEGDTPMSFFDHLAELRTRLIRAAIGVLVGFVISFYFVREFLALLKRPLQGAWEAADLPGQPATHSLGPIDDSDISWVASSSRRSSSDWVGSSGGW